MKHRMMLLTVLLLASVLRADEPTTAPVEDSADPLAGAPVPLAEAFRKYGHDVERWAYTEHEWNFGKEGKVVGERIVSYDPSQPYEQQWTLLKRNGQEPTASQKDAYRREKAKHLKNRKTLGDLLETNKSRVVSETRDSITYEVPLRAEESNRLPPDKFQVLVEVARESTTLLKVEARLRSPLRVALVGKVKKAGAVISFSSVDPKYAPAITGIKANGSGSVFFIPVSGTYELTRTDFRRVKPYSDRFVVRPGPLKWLDF